jgi:hypothetical protein
MKNAFVLFFLLLPALAQAQLSFSLESGAVLGTRYNEVRIPNAGGTLFDLGKDLKANPKVYFRARLGYTLGERHTISVLYAPLAINYTGSFTRDVVFNGVTFGPRQFGNPEAVTARYQFNSYRLTYRYDFIANPKLRVGAGFTAKIRDADIRLSSERATTHYDNVGFVPLLNLVATWKPTGKLLVLLEADALAAPQGRAEDVFVGLGYQLNPFVSLRGGYRVVEGGADNDKIYNFTWINYAAVGLAVAF